MSTLKELKTQSTLMLIFLGVVLIGGGGLIPSSLLYLWELMLFAWGIWLLTLAVDTKAYFPFAPLHSVFGTLFAVGLVFPIIRIALLHGLLVPRETFLIIIGVWWASVLIHSIFSESRLNSYMGGIERGMGLIDRLTIPIYIIAAFQLLTFYGFNIVIMLMLTAGIIETLVLTLQFAVDKKWIKEMFTYAKTIGFRRYTGTISNPIPVANFMLLLLPLSFAFYHANFFLFMGIYLVLSWGLMLSHGRSSYIALWIVTLLEMIYVITMFNSIPILFLSILTLLWGPLYYLITPQASNTISRIKGLQEVVNGDTQHLSSANNRLIIWKNALRMIRKHPFTGYGISNVARAIRHNMNSKTNAYFPDQSIDRSHNAFLDLLVEGGVTHLIVYLFMAIISIGMGVITGMPFLSIALIGFLIDVFFSFPLYPNYLFSFLVILLAFGSSGMLITNPISLSLSIGAIAVLGGMNVVGLIVSHKRNMSQRLWTVGLNGQNAKQTQLSYMLYALAEMPEEQRSYSWFSEQIENMLMAKKFEVNDLMYVDNWITSNKKYILQNSEMPDLVLAITAQTRIAVFRATNNPLYLTMAWADIKQGVKFNPQGVKIRTALLSFFDIMGDINKNNPIIRAKEYYIVLAILKKLINDFEKAPYPNKALEAGYWTSLLAVCDILNDPDTKQEYTENFAARFPEDPKK